MSETLQVRVFYGVEEAEHSKDLVFEKAKDGWWENKTHFLVVDPRLQHCLTSPWNEGTEYYEDAPEHRFEVIQ